MRLTPRAIIKRLIVGSGQLPSERRPHFPPLHVIRDLQSVPKSHEHRATGHYPPAPAVPREAECYLQRRGSSRLFTQICYYGFGLMAIGIAIIRRL